MRDMAHSICLIKLYQITMRKNFNVLFLTTLNNKPPAPEEFTSSKLIAENLNAMQRAREAFIRSEASECIKRALRHNIRTSGNTKYFTGDRVYIEKDSDRWSGPGTLLGQDG